MFALSACMEGGSGYVSMPNVAANMARQPEDGRVTVYDSWDIPEYVNPSPNLATLRFYLQRHLADPNGFDRHWVAPAASPSPIAVAGRENPVLTEQILNTSLLSYIMYENGRVVYDEITPRDRFGDLVGRNTRLRSNSVGKSMVSYLLGHAIYSGYIEGLDSRLNDWPIIQNTLYHDQRLIDLVNMTAGDEAHVHDQRGLLASGRWYNTASIRSFAERELRGSRPSRPEGQRAYHYNGLATNVVMNYVIHKSGPNFQTVLNRAFRDGAGIEHGVFFFRNRGYGASDGGSWYMFYASRYDYLRIARAMMQDWQNNTCVGRYLREVHDRRVSKNQRNPDSREKFQSGSSYGGFFHMNYAGMAQRRVLGMDGYGGQAILIDMDNSRIVVANSVHIDYDWYRIVHQAIRNGAVR